MKPIHFIPCENWNVWRTIISTLTHEIGWLVAFAGCCYLTYDPVYSGKDERNFASQQEWFRTFANENHEFRPCRLTDHCLFLFTNVHHRESAYQHRIIRLCTLYECSTVTALRKSSQECWLLFLGCFLFRDLCCDYVNYYRDSFITQMPELCPKAAVRGSPKPDRWTQTYEPTKSLTCDSSLSIVRSRFCAR